MRKIKRVGVMSLAKISGALYGLMGLIGGLVFMIIAFMLPGNTEDPFMHNFLFGIGAPIFLPIFYGIMGFVGGLLSAWLYNIVAKWVGGIEIETE